MVAGFFAVDEGGATGPDGPIPVLVGEIVQKRTRIIAGATIGMAGAILLVWFVSFLRARLAREGDLGALFGSVAYGCGLTATVGALIHASFRLALTNVEDPSLLADAMRPLAILGSGTTSVLFWGMAGLVLAMAIAGLVLRFIPRAMSAVGLGLCAGTIAFSSTDRGGVALALLPWLIVACLMRLRADLHGPPSQSS